MFRQTHKLYLLLAIFSAGCLLASVAQAQYITPQSYTATPGQGRAQGGIYDYFDDTGKQLTDGILGANDWAADLGNGPAYEWTAWLTVDPTMSFHFSSPETISSVQIGFNRYDGAINLPTNVTIGNSSFTLSGNELSDRTRGFLTFNGSFTGSDLNISLADNNPGRWIFVDEVRFVGASTPAPSSLLTTLIGVIPGVILLRRRRG